jgi:hypothetical protein
MIRVSTADSEFNQAYLNAFRALPVGNMEMPRQYGERWREAYRCRVESDNSNWPHHTYIFDSDEDYVMFMLRWS